MKNLFILSLGVLLTQTQMSFAGEDSAIVQSEYVKVQQEFSVSLAQARKSVRDLAAERKRAIESSQAQAKLEQTGIEAMKKYDLLLTIRYTDENGKYQSALELSTKDQENLNKLFETYLRSTPLMGRSSVGHSRRMIEWGMKRLEELSKLHSDPTETNHPELEINAKLARDAETRIKTVTELASRLGVKLNENVATNDNVGPVVEKRMPASR